MKASACKWQRLSVTLRAYILISTSKLENVFTVLTCVCTISAKYFQMNTLFHPNKFYFLALEEMKVQLSG